MNQKIDYEKLHREADRQTAAIMTAYTEAIESNNDINANKLIASMVDEMIDESSKDDQLSLRLQALCRSMACCLDAAHDSMGFSYDDKIQAIQLMGLMAADDGWS